MDYITVPHSHNVIQMPITVKKFKPAQVKQRKTFFPMHRTRNSDASELRGDMRRQLRKIVSKMTCDYNLSDIGTQQCKCTDPSIQDGKHWKWGRDTEGEHGYILLLNTQPRKDQVIGKGQKAPLRQVWQKRRPFQWFLYQLGINWILSVSLYQSNINTGYLYLDLYSLLNCS